MLYVYHINKSTSFNEGDTQQCSTDKLVALEFPIKLELRNVGFRGGRKTGEPGKKPLEQGQEPTTNSTHMTPGAGIKPRDTLVGGEYKVIQHLPKIFSEISGGSESNS